MGSDSLFFRFNLLLSFILTQKRMQKLFSNGDNNEMLQDLIQVTSNDLIDDQEEWDLKS